MSWSDSIAHQTCSSGTHGVVGHIFHHHPTRKASSDSLPRNWYQVIYICISSFIWITCAITRHAFHLKIHIQRGSHVLQFSICSHCGMSFWKSGWNCTVGKTTEAPWAHRSTEHATCAEQVAPGLPPIVQNGYPILSCVYEIIWVFICDDVYLLIVFDSFLEADHAIRAPIILIYIYINTSIIIVTGLVPLGHVTSWNACAMVQNGMQWVIYPSWRLGKLWHCVPPFNFSSNFAIGLLCSMNRLSWWSRQFKASHLNLGESIPTWKITVKANPNTLATEQVLRLPHCWHRSLASARVFGS